MRCKFIPSIFLSLLLLIGASFIATASVDAAQVTHGVRNGREAAHPISIAGVWKGHLSVSPISGISVFAITDSGSGHANILGPFALRASEVANFTVGTITDGKFALTNSSGDSISGTYVGTFSMISAKKYAFNSQGQITAGTGKLSGATGTITFSGGVSSSSLNIVGRLKATISLP